MWDVFSLLGLDGVADATSLESGLWVAIAVVLAAAALRAARRSPEARRELLFLALLTGGALLLRWALAVHGPGDYKVTLADAFDESNGRGHGYGSAPWALLSFLQAAIPREHLLLWPNLVLGALSPALLTVLARELRVDRRVAWTAGLLLALHPLALRFSGVENRSMYVLFLEIVAFFGMARYWRRGEWSALLMALAGAILALDTRPEAIRVVPEMVLLVGSLTLFAHRPSTNLLSGRTVGVAVILLVLALPVVAQLASGVLVGNVEEVAGLRNYLSPDANIWLDPGYTPWPFVALLVVGLVFVKRDRQHRVLVWAVGALLVSAFTASAHPTGENLASSRYQINALVFSCLLAALGTVRVWELFGKRGAGLGAVPRGLLLVAAAVSTLGTTRALVTPRTIDLEYRFLREVVRRLPPDAELYEMPFIHGDAHLTRADFLSRVFEKRSQRWLFYPPDAPWSGAPRFYVHRAACAMHADSKGGLDEARIRIRDGCTTARARYADAVVMERTIPARRHSDDHYDVKEIVLGVYRIPDDEQLALPGPNAPHWVLDSRQ